jgi:GAG-pre-integrase domain
MFFVWRRDGRSMASSPTENGP